MGKERPLKMKEEASTPGRKRTEKEQEKLELLCSVFDDLCTVSGCPHEHGKLGSSKGRGPSLAQKAEPVSALVR